MADFDPDSYLSQKGTSTGFDPDRYLSRREDSLNPETTKALSDFAPLPETETGTKAPAWSGLRNAALGVTGLTPLGPFMSAPFLWNKMQESGRVTWSDPAAGRAARTNLLSNIKDFYGAHATWGDTPAGREAQQLPQQYPGAFPPQSFGTTPNFLEELKKPVIAAGKTLGAFVPTSLEGAKSQLTMMMGAGVDPQAWMNQVAKTSVGNAVLIHRARQSPMFSQEWWDNIMPLAAQGLMELGAVKAIFGGGSVKPPIQTDPIPAAGIKMAPDQFEEAAQARLGELDAQDSLTPVEEAEKANLEAGLSEGGDVGTLASQHGIEIGGETDAIQPSDAQVEGGKTPQRVEARPEGEVPVAGGSDYVERAAQGAEPGREVPPEPVSPGESVVAAPPEPAHEPGTALAEEPPPETPAAEPQAPVETGPPKTGTTISHQGRLMDVVKVESRPIKGTYFVHLRPAGKPKGKAIVTRWPQRKLMFKTRPPADNFGSDTTPVANFVMGNGGVLSRTGAVRRGIFARSPDLWDDVAKLSHPTHNRIYQVNGVLPDKMAQMLYDEGLINDPYAGTMWRELEKESRTVRGEASMEREAAREEKAATREAGQQKKAFEEGQQNVYRQHASQGKEAPKVQAADLGIGDTVTVDGQELKVKDIDVDNLNVTLEDGKRFGIQEVGANEIIWGEHEPAPVSDEFVPPGEEETPTQPAKEFALEKPESVEEQKARVAREETQKAARATETEKKAQVKYGWQQKKTGTTGDLGQMEIEQVEQRPQGDLFAQGKKLRLRSEKEGGYVNAEIMREVLDFGRNLYRKGMDFARWAGEMVRHLGEKIAEHLQPIWRSITGQNILPHARERGSVPIPGPKREKGFSFKPPGERQFAVFQSEAQKKGYDPTPDLYDYWKNHLESLPEPGESFQTHSERVPAMQVNAGTYTDAMANNQIMLASQIKRAAYKRGVNLAEPTATAPPTVLPGPENEVTVRMASKGKQKAVSFTLQPDQIPAFIQKQLAMGNSIISAPKGAISKIANMEKANVLPSQRTAAGLPEWEPARDEAPGVVNDADGSWKQPPPPGSGNGPTPPGQNPWKASKRSLGTKWRDWWENFWPRTRAAIALEGETPVVTAHHQWLTDIQDGIFDYVDTEAHQTLAKMDMNDVIRQEHFDVQLYQYHRFAEGDHPDVAWEKAIKDSPLSPVYRYIRDREAEISAAAKELAMPKPSRIEGPYLPRTTNEEGKAIVNAPYEEKTMGGMLRKSMGVFDNSRTHDTMLTGISQKVPVQYNPAIESAWHHNKYGTQLIATARLVKTLRDEGVLFDKYEDALRASKDKDPQKLRANAFGGRDYWVRNRQESVFIKQNFLERGFRTPWSKFNELTNSWIRNPELVNPAPHVTKNMGYKYLLGLINAETMKRDAVEFMTGSDLRKVFEHYYPMPKSELRIPQIEAREIGNWYQKVTNKGISINGPSQKFIFHTADPAMRFSLWKHYVRNGLSHQEAANRVALDLVRYDENSGGLNLWKSTPFNWFSTWRTGTYVTLFNHLKRNPVRTIAFIGALDYIREVIYRKTGKWTHMPHDYLEAPIAEAVEAGIRAKHEMDAGRSPAKALGGAAISVAGILGTTFAFGPGGGQAPDTIGQLMGVLKGDPGARLRVMNMFFGLSQMFNMSSEFYLYLRDGKSEHLTNIITSAAFGTHTALKYEPRRAAKYIPESWLPGFKYSEEVATAGALREKREERANRALSTSETRHGVTRGFYQGSEEQQMEDLARGAGKRPKKKIRF